MKIPGLAIESDGLAVYKGQGHPPSHSPVLCLVRMKGGRIHSSAGKGTSTCLFILLTAVRVASETEAAFAVAAKAAVATRAVVATRTAMAELPIRAKKTELLVPKVIAGLVEDVVIDGQWI